MVPQNVSHSLSWRFFALILIAYASAGAVTWGQPYQADINRWVAQDALDAPSAGSILFAGSSSIRRWEQLAFDFADCKIIQRGFGGSQFEQLTGFVDDIVLPYNLSAIVIWEGTNDIASGESGNEVFADYQDFVTAVHSSQPNVDIFYLGIMPTPGRRTNQPQERIANQAISTLAAGNSKLHYVDLPTSFATLNPYGDPAFTSKFVDSIHLNRAGYHFWTSVIRPQIEAVIAPNKVFAANPDTLQPGREILFDFGPNSQGAEHTLGPDANGNIWNNWHPLARGGVINAGEHLGNLIDTTGATTGIDLTITGGFEAKISGGLSEPDGELLGDLAVENATKDYFLSSADDRQGRGSDDVPGGFMLDGFDPQLAYDFQFFGSRRTSSTWVTEYLVTGANSKATTLQTSGSDIGADGEYDANDDEIALISGIRPDPFGQIFVDLTLVQGRFAFLNAMRVSVSVPEPSTAGFAFVAAVAFLNFGWQGIRNRIRTR